MKETKEMKDRLTEMRKRAKLSQQDLADKLFVSRSTVSRWENGASQPTATACKLMRAIRDCPSVLPSLGVRVAASGSGIEAPAFSVIQGGKTAWHACQQAKTGDGDFEMRM